MMIEVIIKTNFLSEDSENYLRWITWIIVKSPTYIKFLNWTKIFFSVLNIKYLVIYSQCFFGVPFEMIKNSKSIWLATSFWNLKVSKQFGVAHFSNIKIWIWLICFEIKSTNSFLTWDFKLNFKLGYLSKNCGRHLFTYVISKGS